MYLNNPKNQYLPNSNLNQEECKVKEAKDEESPIWSSTPTMVYIYISAAPTIVYIYIYCPHHGLHLHLLPPP